MEANNTMTTLAHAAPCLASQLALGASGAFFMTGLLCGAWKYAHIHLNAREGSEAKAPVYVDIAHRAALMYAFACLVVERFVEASDLPAHVETGAVLAQVVFFALAVMTYVLHGVLQDTDNQLQRPHKLARWTLPNVLIMVFMGALMAGEIGGFAVLLWGAVFA